MSRLHLILNQLAQFDCNQKNINKFLDQMIDSQGGISQNATLELRFDLILEKSALVSGEVGFQSYPVVVRAEKNAQGFVHGFEITIPYSSTCPCSASLSRQLYARAIEQSIPGKTINKADLMEWAQSQIGLVATPHC